MVVCILENFYINRHRETDRLGAVQPKDVEQVADDHNENLNKKKVSRTRRWLAAASKRTVLALCRDYHQCVAEHACKKQKSFGTSLKVVVAAD